MEKRQHPVGKPAGPPQASRTPPQPPTPQRLPSRAPQEPVSRPRLFDFLAIFLGVMISITLAQMAGLRAVPTRVRDLGQVEMLIISLLPMGLFLPIGPILFWPFYYVTQLVLRRTQGLSSGEWLLGISWMVYLTLALWIVCRYAGILPTALESADVRKYVALGFLVFIVAMAVLAAGVWLLDLVFRWRTPWTQGFAIAALIWPALPLALLWVFSWKLDWDAGLAMNIPVPL